MPITPNVVSSNPSYGEVYSRQHYVIKFISDLWQIGGIPGTPVSSSSKTDHHDEYCSVFSRGLQMTHGKSVFEKNVCIYISSHA